MPLLESTKNIQNKLASYCQTGNENTTIEGARNERLPHYRRLVFNVIKDSLNSAYPLTRKLVGQETFEEMCHDFFSNHACQEPQVFRMTGEFADFMKANCKPDVLDNHPFILELLDFERAEMDMYMMEDIEHPIPKEGGDWLIDNIMLNPESRLLQYAYPVFKKKPGEITTKDKALYYCIAFRQPVTGKVLFIDVSPVVAVVISEIAEGQNLDYTVQALKDSGVHLSESNINAIISFLKQEINSGFVLGFYR